MRAKTTAADGTKAVSDGHPTDEVQYLEHKVILQPSPMSSRKGFGEFAKLVRHAAKELDIAQFRFELPPKFRVRDVLFYDTPGADLYNHSFILRRRTYYEDGWPEGETEQTLKFRHVELERAAEVDVCPSIEIPYTIKFKEELLPLRNEVGGMRSLYSHNCVVYAPELPWPGTFAELADLFPAVSRLSVSPKARIALVNGLAVEEISTDVGELHFGHGLQSKADLSVWRNRGTQEAMSAEFSFQCKFHRYDDLHQKSKKKAEHFFTFLQQTAKDWVQTGVTKTALVYRAGGTAPRNHE
jgi:hypothetical protein